MDDWTLRRHQSLLRPPGPRREQPATSPHPPGNIDGPTKSIEVVRHAVEINAYADEVKDYHAAAANHPARGHRFTGSTTSDGKRP
jgi:hypothetical protein